MTTAADNTPPEEDDTSPSPRPAQSTGDASHRVRPSRERLDILEVLANGLRIGDKRLTERCLRALQSAARDDVELLEACANYPDISLLHRENLVTAVDWIRNRRAPTRNPADDVLLALLDALRVDDDLLNAKAIGVFAGLPAVAVDRLITEAGRRNITPGHCLRLLTAIGLNGGTLNWRGAGVLVRIQRREGFEIVWGTAHHLMLTQFALRPDRTFIGR